MNNNQNNTSNTLNALDCISRQAAIDAECKVCTVVPEKSRGIKCDYYPDGCCEVMCLFELPSAQQWIPVSERLPEKKTEVIYSLENHYVSTGYMTDRDYEGNIVELHWEDLESGVLIYPEAWMPLPEPYKEVRDEYSN